MIGFSFFMFEGIGSVMPVMNACNQEAKNNFPYLIAGALITLCTMYILFSELCYYTFGNHLDEAIVMLEMPAHDPVIQLVKALYCFNLLFSYPLCIYPTNLVIDNLLFDRLLNLQRGSTRRYWLENVSRICVLLAGILLAIFFYDKLDKILALCGTILGTTVVLFIPACCHYTIMGRSHVDMFIACYAVLMLFVVSSIVFSNWNN